MFRFTLTQLLMTVALVAILLGLVNSEGCGTRICKVSDVAFSPDGKLLAVVKNNARAANVPFKSYLRDVSRTISILEAVTGKTERIVEQEKCWGEEVAVGLYRHLQKSVAFGPKGNMLLVQTFRGGVVRTYDLQSGEWQNPFKEFELERLWNFSTTPDGTRMVATSYNFLISYDVTSGQPSRLQYADSKVSYHLAPLIAVSADGNHIATAEWSAVELRRTSDGNLVNSVAGLTEQDLIYGLALSADGRYLAVDAEKWLRVYDLKSSQQCKAAAKQGYGKLAFSPDSRTLAVANDDRVDLLAADSGRHEGCFQGNKYITSLAFSPQGDVLAIGDTAGYVTLWNMKIGRPMWKRAAPGTWGVAWIYPISALILWGVMCVYIAKRRG